MKKSTILFLFLLSILSIGCEDVVDVNLKSDTPKLVIDASINWFKGTSGNEQKIKLTTTTDFFSNTIPTVSGAIVTVQNSTNTTFTFTEVPNSGEYICTNFIPVLNETYTLTIINNGQTYKSVETLKPVASITTITQNNQGGFTGTDIEVKAFFDDPSNEENYYLFNYSYPSIVKPDFYVTEDEFFNGNPFFSLLLDTNNDSNISQNDLIKITHYGISKQYFNYMNVLLSVSGSSGGGPFQSPPATVKGNIINNTNFENYALGYFRLSEVDTRDYIIQ